jgi:transcriptional regulator
MYNPPLFVEKREEVLYALMREHPLATLVWSDHGAIEVAHAPVFLDVEKRALRSHVARGNPILRAIAHGGKLVAMFHGPQHYISPSWYPSKAEHGKVVPTWNYAVVHVTGKVRALDAPGELLRHLRELTDRNEATVGGKWEVADAPTEYVDGLLNSITGMEIAIERIEGKWKVSQNRTLEDRKGVIAGLAGLGTPAALDMAHLVRAYLPPV